MKKKAHILLFFIFLSCNLSAQKQIIKYQPYGDYKYYHLGISIGLNFQDVLITNSGKKNEQENETWFATIPDYSPGFSVGLLADVYLNAYMNLRFTPMLHFGDNSFNFVEPTIKKSYHSIIRSNYLTTPVELKFRSLRLNNYRPYVFGGGYTAFNLGRKTDEAVYFNILDYGFTLGLGCDFYLPIIKVVPELRFSFGLADIICHNRKDLTDNNLRKYSNSIGKGVTRMISLTFNFE